MKTLLFFLFIFSTVYSNIRPLQEKDIEVLYEMICNLASHDGVDSATFPVTKEKLQKYGFGPNRYFLGEVAEIDEKVVGYALYYYTFSGYQGSPVLYINNLYVKPDYRGQGIGTQLLKRLAQYGVEHECCRIALDVFEWNETAFAFFKKFGGQLKKDLILVRLEKEAMHQLAAD